jgi:hypothetical protein
VAEVEWDDDTRGWHLALLDAEERERHRRCPKCGGPPEECQAPEHDGLFDVTLPVRCHRTTAQLVAQDQVGKDVQHPEALVFDLPVLSTAGEPPAAPADDEGVFGDA